MNLVFKVSFQNFHKRMNMYTRYYAKRCFLSLIENLAKQILCIPDKLYIDMLNFLDEADNTKNIKSTDLSNINSLLYNNNINLKIFI